jgi:hypothetical protein
VAAESGERRDHAGVDARDELIRFLPFVAAHQQRAGAAGQIGHVRAPLVEDQAQAGAQAIPTLLQRRNAGIAARDLEGDGGRGKGFLQLVDPGANLRRD